MLTYVGPDDGEGSPSLVVTREDLLAHMTVGRYAAMQDAAVRAGFTGVDLLEDRETTVAGHPAVRRTYRWSHDGRVMRQRIWCWWWKASATRSWRRRRDAAFDALRGTFAAALRSFRPG